MKNLGPTKYRREKIVDPRNNEKNWEPRSTPTKKYFGPTKYPREKVLNPRNTHEGTMGLDPRDLQWHATHEI